MIGIPLEASCALSDATAFERIGLGPLVVRQRRHRYFFFFGTAVFRTMVWDPTRSAVLS